MGMFDNREGPFLDAVREDPYDEASVSAYAADHPAAEVRANFIQLCLARRRLLGTRRRQLIQERLALEAQSHSLLDVGLLHRSGGWEASSRGGALSALPRGPH